MEKANSSPASVALHNVPTTWPGAFGLYKYSKKAVNRNLGTVIVISLLGIIVNGSGEALHKNGGGVVGLIFGSLIDAALVLVLIASVRGKKLEISEAFSQAAHFWLRIIALNILVALSLIVSILLLIVPFFFVFPRLILANYFLLDKDMDIMEAYKASWHASEGHAGKIWGIIGANLAIIALAVTIIGIPFSIYFFLMYSAATALAYEFIRKHTHPVKAE